MIHFVVLQTIRSYCLAIEIKMNFNQNIAISLSLLVGNLLLSLLLLNSGSKFNVTYNRHIYDKYQTKISIGTIPGNTRVGTHRERSMIENVGKDCSDELN
jgi:hypothetical protein